MIWIDVLQFVIYIGAGLIALAVIGREVPGGWSAILGQAGEAGKLRVFDFDPSPFKVQTFWAGMIGAMYSIPASVFRAYGGHLSDRVGARQVMYWTFLVGALATFILSYPPTSYVVDGIHGPMSFRLSTGLIPFTVILFVLGFFMSLGKAAVYKHIPVYYPKDVGAVGGLVGMIGGLGGFVLPIVFGAVLDVTGVYTSCFMLLFLLVGLALSWMHLSIRVMERRTIGAALDSLPELPEMAEIHQPGKTVMPREIEDWRPEDPGFWASTGKHVAHRNLWLSIPALTLAFSVWMVWSMVVAKLPAIGFAFTPDQLFWLAALPALSGATLRIFYGFMVPIFGGRLWTTLSTASLLIPAVGIGYAVQNPTTPYLIFLILALLCGLGGANFASSMANIGYFFPKAEKGHALAMNAGLGNLGVSLMQFLVPLVITAGVFGVVGGNAQPVSDGGQLWLQNAGFIWVPFILASTVAAWLGMNDLADARASFSQQAVIFGRAHNWVMCVLYIGTCNGAATNLTKWDRATETFTAVTGLDSLLFIPQSLPSGFCEDRAGNLWIGFYAGEVVRYRNGRFERMPFDAGSVIGEVRWLHLDGAGRLWVAINRVGLRRIDDARVQVVCDDTGSVATGRIRIGAIIRPSWRTCRQVGGNYSSHVGTGFCGPAPGGAIRGYCSLCNGGTRGQVGTGNGSRCVLTLRSCRARASRHIPLATSNRRRG